MTADSHSSSSSRDPDQGVRAYPIEAEEALTAWMATRTEGVWTSPAGWWYAAWMHRQAEVEQLKAKLAAADRFAHEQEETARRIAFEAGELQAQVAHLTGYADGLKRGSDLHEQRKGELEKQVADQRQLFIAQYKIIESLRAQLAAQTAVVEQLREQIAAMEKGTTDSHSSVDLEAMKIRLDAARGTDFEEHPDVWTGNSDARWEFDRYVRQDFPVLLAEVSRLKAQLAAQNAVISDARKAVAPSGNPVERMRASNALRDSLARLDAADSQ